MIRRDFLIKTGAVTGILLLRNTGADAHTIDKDLKFTALEKPESEWRKLLSQDQYHILFDEGTEPAGSSPLDHEKRVGTFICAACYLPLFESTTKYNSGTGWPSFYQSIPDRVVKKRDLILIIPR
ncbi:MAG: msrB, partial [Gammaproteobacteria bacterium]|nr:msrB [Gammaproteobacteria bacterium]